MRRNSEFFTVNYQGIALEFEFYNIDYIFNQLTKLKEAGKFQSVDKIKLPNRGKARVIRETCSEKITENDRLQAIFVEKYVQRMFNLLDS